MHQARKPILDWGARTRPDPWPSLAIITINPKVHVRVHQAQRPDPDEGVRTRPDPWPSPGVITVDLAGCLGLASQLEGEQNTHVPSVGSGPHVAPVAPQFSSSSSSPFSSDTLAHENPPREGAASERCAADTCPEPWEPPDLSCGEGAAIERRATETRRPEPWKPPDPHDEVLQELGGVLSAPGNVPVIQDHLGPAAMIENADVRLPEHSSVDAHERGGALPVVGAAPALAEGTADVEPAGEAEIATAARPEALVPWAQGDAKLEVETPLQEGRRKPEALPRKGGQTHEPPLEALPPEGRCNLEAPPQEREQEANAPPQSNPNKGETSPVGRRESRRAKASCLLRKDPALGIQEGGRRGCTPSSRKNLLRLWMPHRASTPTTTTTAGIVTRLQETWPPQKKSEAAPTITRRPRT